MNEPDEAPPEHADGRLRRLGRWIRRHPAKALAAVPLVFVLYVAALYPFTPSIGDIRKSRQESPSVVLTADGKELAVFKRANRDWVKLADISPNVTKALLATEDKRFYEHHGIDVVRTLKAVFNTLTGDVEGGSTITQQLARNLYPEEIGREQTVTRKVKEAITALKIEAVYSKDEILESYLNSVSFLYNAWGIEMAARTYYGKPAKDLNQLQAATLIGMLKGTSYYNPVLNPERALQRRNRVLAQMVKADVLDEANYEQLKDQPLKLDFTRQPDEAGMAPHLAEYLRRWLLDWADRNDYNIYADGLVVKTTIDSRLQEFANQAVERQGKALQAVADVEWSRKALASLGSDPSAYVAARGKSAPFEYFWNSHGELVDGWIRDSAEYRQARQEGRSAEEALKQLRGDAKFMADLRRSKTMLQAGFLAIEPQTGAVRAWVGSRDWDEDKFDHVQQARRQPGSTFKPFVYGAAFEMGHQPYETLMDEPVQIQIDRNKFWRPGDVEGTPSYQPMTLRDGLAKSKNTITAQLMMQVGPSRVASLARAMGVRESRLDEVPSLALGTSPVTLKEMVTSFATIANGGNYIAPQIVTAVEDRHHTVLESFGTHQPEQALSNQAAMTLLDVMRGVIDGGTAAGLRPRFGLSGDLAGKTGTTQDNTDGWFILMHPQLVAGAWVGFNDNRVTMRSNYWGQGAHNALLLVGDMVQHAEKGGVIDARATFAAPHLQPPERPLIDRMGDWWNSVFNTAPSQSDPTVAALPEVKLPELDLEPPKLEPPPSPDTHPLPPPASLNLPPLPPAMASPPTAGLPPGSALPPPSGLPPAPPVTAEAPVRVEPQRVPSFPRPLESARPVETVPGTHVYPQPEMATRRPDPAEPADVVRGPSRSATSSMGAAPAGSSPSPARPRAAATASSPPPAAADASGPQRRPAPVQVTPRDDGTVTLSRDNAVTLTMPGGDASPASGGSASNDSSTSSMGSGPAPGGADTAGGSAY
jgi:penicillin-binding protein 1A